MAYSAYGGMPFSRPRSHVGYGADPMAYPNQAAYSNVCGLKIFPLQCSESSISTANHPIRFMALHGLPYQRRTV